MRRYSANAIIVEREQRYRTNEDNTEHKGTYKGDTLLVAIARPNYCLS